MIRNSSLCYNTSDILLSISVEHYIKERGLYMTYQVGVTANSFPRELKLDIILQWCEEAEADFFEVRKECLGLRSDNDFLYKVADAVTEILHNRPLFSAPIPALSDIRGVESGQIIPAITDSLMLHAVVTKIGLGIWQHHEKYRAELAWLGRWLWDRGGLLTIENGPYVDQAEIISWKALFESIARWTNAGRPSVQMTFDPGNWLNAGGSYESVIEAAKQLHEYIVYMHVKCVDSKTEEGCGIIKSLDQYPPLQYLDSLKYIAVEFPVRSAEELKTYVDIVRSGKFDIRMV